MIRLLPILLLAGCATTAPVQVKVPYPVPCRETLPERPVMPTEGLKPGSTLDSFAAAAQAEIERRQGYELVLVQKLMSCISE